MEYQDRTLTCIQCNQTFVFTAGEQEFYARKGFEDEPKRCKPCRDARKQRLNDRASAGGVSGSSQGNGQYNGSYANGGGGGYGNTSSDDDNIGNDFGNSSAHRQTGHGHQSNGYGSSYSNGGSYSGAGGEGRREREMHEVVCSRCSKPARVPFRPTAGRPVFCRECFAAQRAEGG